MRLAVVTNILAPYRVPLFDALASRVDDFAVFLMAERHRSRDWDVGKPAFRTHVLPGVALRLRRDWVDPMHFNVGAAMKIAAFRPNVILNNGYSLANIEALLHARATSATHLIWGELTLRDGAERSAIRRSLRRWMIRGSSGCVASSSVARDAFLHYGAARERILVSNMPIGTESIRREVEALQAAGAVTRTQDIHAPRFLFVGRLEEIKGVVALLKAFRLVQRQLPGASLVLVGDGSGRSRHEALARELNLDNVVFTGFARRDALMRHYAAAGIFVFPSHFDPYGAVLPEAMAAGLIAVSSPYAAATRDLIAPGVNGFVADPHDVVDLARSMLTAAGLTHAEADEMRAAARARVSGDDYAASAEEIVRFARSLRAGDRSMLPGGRSCSETRPS